MLKPFAKLGFNKGIFQRYSPVSSFGGDSDGDLSPGSELCFTHRAVPVQKRIEPLIGTLASNYNVLGVIHDGGDQCQVKRVRAKDDGTVYVVKIQDKQLLRSQNESLFREMTIRLMNTLENEHIVQIQSCFEDSDNFYTVQEACDGGNLVDFLKLTESKELGIDVETLENEVRQVMGELLLSLDHFHKSGLVHKDVKLENAVFKTKRVVTRKDPNLPKYKMPRVLKLIDFDYVTEWKGKKAKDVVGTDGYIAPEAYLGRVCPKSDIFSAGVVMFLLIAGRFPYADEIFDDGVNENYVGHPKMQEIYDKLQTTDVRFGRSWQHLQEAKAFCKALLECSVDKRPTAEEALKHPWMAKFFEEMKLPRVTEEVPNLAVSKVSNGRNETKKKLTRRQAVH